MEVKVSFSDQEIELVLIALGELPFKTAAPMIQKINAQIAGQKALLQKESEDNSVPVDSPSLEEFDAFWAGSSQMQESNFAPSGASPDNI